MQDTRPSNDRRRAPDLLDNAVWHALTTRHEVFAEVHGAARRYDPEVSVFGATADDSPESWHDLATLVGPGGAAVIFREGAIEPPDGWTIGLGGPGDQMIFEGDLDGFRPLRDDPIVTLRAEHVPSMLELIALTQPGPFRSRTIELGGYRGIFEGERLVAMAGRRLSVPGYVEISAVCTHPDARGRGYAATLTIDVARSIAADGDTPMLHMASHNAPARRVYDQLGFHTRRIANFMMLTAPDRP